MNLDTRTSRFKFIFREKKNCKLVIYIHTRTLHKLEINVRIRKLESLTDPGPSRIQIIFQIKNTNTISDLDPFSFTNLQVIKVHIRDL
jgi:hypothetical protein